MKSQIRFCEKKLFKSRDDLNDWVEIKVNDYEMQDLRGDHVKDYVNNLLSELAEVSFPCILFYDVNFQDERYGGIVFAEDFKKKKKKKK